MARLPIQVRTLVFSGISRKNHILYKLFDIIQERKANPTPGSYTAQLFSSGEDHISQKMGEEAAEIILAAKGQGKRRLIAEKAGLFYHTLVLLASQGITLSEVEAELRLKHTSPEGKLR